MEQLSFKKFPILAVLVIGTILVLLNQALMNTALPVVMRSLEISANAAQWLTTGFMLTNGIVIPITAFLIQRFSTRKLFFITMSFFIAGTLICATAPSFAFLLTGRIIQAIGAGIMLPLTQTVLFAIFPIEKRGFAMGMVGLAAAFAPALGPVFSGWIVQNYSWRLLFYALLPIALLDVVAGIFILKNVTKNTKTKIDILSVILSSIGFGGLMYGFSIAGKNGWSSIGVIVSLIIGFVALSLFVWRQLVIEKPLLELKVFKNSTFTLTTIISMIVMMALLSSQLLLPLYMQSSLGFTPMESGLTLLPGAIIMGIMSLIAGKIFDKIGARSIGIVGLIIGSAMTFLFTHLTKTTSHTFIIAVYSVLMFGLSLVLMPVATAGLNQLPQALTPHGITMNNTLRQIAASIGTALLVTVMIKSGIKAAFMISTVVTIIALILTLFINRKNPEN